MKFTKFIIYSFTFCILAIQSFEISHARTASKVEKVEITLNNIVHFTGQYYSENCNGVIIHPRVILTTPYCSKNINIDSSKTKVIWPNNKNSTTKKIRYEYTALYSISNILKKISYIILDRDIPIEKSDYIPFLDYEIATTLFDNMTSLNMTGYLNQRTSHQVYQAPLVLKDLSRAYQGFGSSILFENNETYNTYSSLLLFNLSIGKKIVALRTENFDGDIQFIIPSFNKEWLRSEIGYDMDLNDNNDNELISQRIICNYYEKNKSDINREINSLAILEQLLYKYKDNNNNYINLPSCLPRDIFETATQAIIDHTFSNNYSYKRGLSLGIKDNLLVQVAKLEAQKQLQFDDYITLRQYNLKHYISIDISLKFQTKKINERNYYHLIKKLKDHASVMKHIADEKSKAAGKKATPPTLTKNTKKTK